jgi:hypothetical protein
MPSLHRIAALSLALCLPLALGSCTTLQEVANLRNVQFDIDRVSGTNLAGVDVQRIRSYDDLRGGDVARLASALARGEAPLTFTLHVGAENPAGNSVAARLVQLDWTLFLDETETISGIFNDTRVIAPGASVDIPITMELDLVRLVGRNIQDIVELAAAVSGQGTKEIALRARPTITTPIGPITYPSDITIVRRDVGN